MSQEIELFQDAEANQALTISSLFGDSAVQANEDLAAGIGGSYAIVSAKGSRFQIKYQGNTTIVTGPTGDPVGSLEVVIVKGNPNITKQYYAKGFTEGDTSAPDCFSLDGKVPSDTVAQPQHVNCATCPKNQFGSRINPTTGVKSKACADNRKLAVVPLGDLQNELLGGPMLLRVSATALKDLAQFAETLKARGYPYNAVATRIGFDLSVSYPKFTFKAIRPLTDEEAAVILEWAGSEQVEKVLADFTTAPADALAEPAADVFEEPPAAAPKSAVQPAPPVAKPAAPKAAAPAPKPAAAAPKAPTPAPAAKPKATVPAAPKPVAAKPAAPKPVPAAVPPEAAAEDVEADMTTEAVPGNLENDIASILADLNSIPSE